MAALPHVIASCVATAPDAQCAKLGGHRGAGEFQAGPSSGPIDAAYRAHHAGAGGHAELRGPRGALDREPADPARARAFDRRYGPAALGLSLGVCVLPASRRRARRSGGAAPVARGGPDGVVPRAGRRRARHQLRAILDRPRLSWPRRGADVLLLRAGDAGLVQPPPARARNGHLQLHLLARALHRAADPHLPHARIWLALDVHRHGHPWPGHRGDLVHAVPRCARDAAHA